MLIFLYNYRLHRLIHHKGVILSVAKNLRRLRINSAKNLIAIETLRYAQGDREGVAILLLSFYLV